MMLRESQNLSEERELSILHKEALEFEGSHGWRLLGSQVDKPSKFLIKTSNAREYLKSDIQNIEAPIIDDPII